MKIHKFKDFFRGWIIGNFEPSILKTKDFEVGVLFHKKGEQWDTHYHQYCVEYNYLISGKMIIQNTELNSGDIFILDKFEVANPIFLEDCTILVIKTPSIPDDKVIL